jgi:hypothetical protein
MGGLARGELATVRTVRKEGEVYQLLSATEKEKQQGRFLKTPSLFCPDVVFGSALSESLLLGITFLFVSSNSFPSLLFQESNPPQQATLPFTIMPKDAPFSTMAPASSQALAREEEAKAKYLAVKKTFEDETLPTLLATIGSW